MKFKTTQKAIKANYPVIIQVAYCDLYHLLVDMSPIAYTTRVEGWGADVYDLGQGVVIVTGYAPFGNVRPSKRICCKYEQMARVVSGHTITYTAIHNKLDVLRKQFVQEVLQDD